MSTATKNIIAALALILAAVFLVVIVTPWASSPTRWSGTMASIEEKTDTVLKLTATASLAAAGLSALPDDMATPVAEKLADFSEYFLLILCVLYAEKFLLTVLGVGAFRWVIPLALLCMAVSVFRYKEKLQPLAARLILVSLALYFAIPASIGCSDLIYDTYRESIEQVIASAEEISDESAALVQEENQNGLERIISGVTRAAAALKDKASDILKQFVESLAVLIVTSCVIPVVVLLLFLWVAAQFLGIDVKMDRYPFRFRHSEKPPVE